MKNTFYKVDGHSGLSKNPVTGTILNTNSNEIDAARSRKKNKINEQEEKQRMKNDIEDLKSSMSEIKSLLKQIVES
jgi:hypothetical protein